MIRQCKVRGRSEWKVLIKTLNIPVSQGPEVSPCQRRTVSAVTGDALRLRVSEENGKAQQFPNYVIRLGIDCICEWHKHCVLAQGWE